MKLISITIVTIDIKISPEANSSDNPAGSPYYLEILKFDL